MTDELRESLESLRASVERLDENVRKDISFGRSFALSVVRGIGYTLGATIVASLVALVLASILQELGRLPVVGDYVERLSGQERGTQETPR